MKFVPFALSLLLCHADGARTRSTIRRTIENKKTLRRGLSMQHRNREAGKEDTSTSVGVESVIDPADAYPNDSMEGEERDCDGYFIKLKFKTDGDGDETGLFLIMEKVNEDEFKFILAAPAMSLGNNKEYPDPDDDTEYYEFCVTQDNNHCYHLDVSDLGDNGFNSDSSGVEMTVTDKDDNKIEFRYDGEWHDKLEIDSDFGDFKYAGFVWGENSDCGDDSRQEDDDDSGGDSREDEDAPEDIDDSCASGDDDVIEIKMKLKTDKDNADDIAITLKEDDKKIWDYDEGSFKDKTTYEWTACVADDKCTKFKFYDSDGKFDGTLELSVDGEEVQGDDDSVEFDDNELVVKIGECTDEDDSREDGDAPEKIDDTSNCDEDNMVEVDMELNTADEEDTKSLAVKLTEDGTVIWDYDAGSFKKETTYDWKTCVDDTVCSKFKFYHDGDLAGNLTLKVDGNTVGEGGSGTTGTWSEDQVTVRIGTCDSDDDSREDDDYAPEKIEDTSKCDEDKDNFIEVKMELETEEEAKYINVTLTEDGEYIWDYGEGSFKDETKYTWKTCVDKRECSKFKASHNIGDSEEDGDGGSSGEDVSGKLTLKVDGKKVGSGSSGTTGKWEEDEVTVRIGSC